MINLQICAIVGGIFSVIGILNSLTLQSYGMLKRKKIEEGKN